MIHPCNHSSRNPTRHPSSAPSSHPSKHPSIQPSISQNHAAIYQATLPAIHPAVHPSSHPSSHPPPIQPEIRPPNPSNHRRRRKRNGNRRRAVSLRGPKCTKQAERGPAATATKKELMQKQYELKASNDTKITKIPLQTAPNHRNEIGRVPLETRGVQEPKRQATSDLQSLKKVDKNQR